MICSTRGTRSSVAEVFAPAPTVIVPTPEQVLQAFNTWAFKREQPTEPDLLLARLASAIDAGEPVRFVLYWGRGPRTEPSWPEQDCLDFLARLVGRVREAYQPGATVCLIMTDTHAALNGYSACATAAYFTAVSEAAAARGFTSCRLSDVVAAGPRAPAATLPLDRPDPDPDMLRRLEECAAKWYRGEGGPALGAGRYYAMNMVEKRALEALFPTAVFLTFNSRAFRALFPDRLPVFYMHSLRKGVSEKPWFVACDGISPCPQPDAPNRPLPGKPAGPIDRGNAPLETAGG